ncbi:hypothetical protein EsH8_VI_000713 [Colletotrichum jinshuiense]
MPRGGKRGGARAPSRSVHHLRSTRGIDRPGPSIAVGTGSTGFTLQDEARSTAHRSSPWSSDSRLRHRPVSFVSTGSTEPLKQLESILHKESGNQPEAVPDVVPTPSNNQGDDRLIDEPTTSMYDDACIHCVTSADNALSVTEAPLYEDEAMEVKASHREDNFTGAETPPMQEAPTTLPFFLDVIGDRHWRDTLSTQTFARSPSPVASDSSEEIILFRGRNNPPKDHDKPKPFNLGGIHSEIKMVEKTVGFKGKSLAGPSGNGGPGLKRHSRRDTKPQNRQEEDDLIADYIANMREHGDDEGLIPAQAYSRRDIGGSLSESESVEESFQTITAIDEPKSATGSTSGPDDTIAETEDMFKGNDEGPRQSAHKHAKRTKAAQVDEALLGVLETDASYLGSLEQSLAEDASLQSETSEQEDIEDDVFASAADRFANEIDDFDFMDWNRPVLKRKKAKGKAPIFDISDSELEGRMQAAWKNDRLKKAERKRERQALRQQGLLGKHANPEDLRVKYPQGMGLDQIAEELKKFLLGSQPSLTLPPMDNHARKIIHELASKFNIKSKSTGSGDQRRPMLHRSFRTTKFAEETFDMAIARVGRKYFPRNDTALRAAVQRQSIRRGGGGGHAGVLYRDGEVVGGSAPELSQDNKGRTMLEKMGWSSGTALGALNNKGILQPVAHVVKRSKAGLG